MPAFRNWNISITEEHTRVGEETRRISDVATSSANTGLEKYGYEHWIMVQMTGDLGITERVW